jgi:hypothetical protein
MIGQRRRHSRLHDALVELDHTHEPQIVTIPEDKKPQYYQKYTAMLAARWGMKVRTRAARGPKAVYMMITERSR